MHIASIVCAVGVYRQLGNACQSALVPEGGATWHVVYAVLESVVNSGIYFLANVVHVTIQWVRLPDLALREVATATVDH